MFPFWMGLNARAVMTINSAWLRSTADLMGLFISGPAQGATTSLLCQSCTTPMISTALHEGDDHGYLRCPNCGLLGLHDSGLGRGRAPCIAHRRSIARSYRVC